jgi:hypothetical protein
VRWCWRLSRLLAGRLGAQPTPSLHMRPSSTAHGTATHYAADNDGHPLGVNRTVPLLYPKMKKKCGDSATYEENPLAHVKTEFGFDVLEVAQGRYAPDSYHDFIGFQVFAPLLEQAFQESDGLDLKSALSDEE